MRLINKALNKALLVCILLVSNQVTAQVANLPINVCASALSGNSIVAMYAQDKGLFTEYGLNVNLVFIEGGSKAVTTLISGDMDICQVSGSPVVNAVVAGVDLVMIAGLFNSYIYSLMVREDINTAKDLKGKALAISKPGSSSDAATRSVLEKLGLVPDKDVAILSVGGQSSRLAAMRSGEIAGTLISVPRTVEAKEIGFRELVDMSESAVPLLHTGIATSRSYITENRETVIIFMRAMVDTIARIKSDRDGTIAVLAKYLLLDPQKNAAALKETYDVLILGYLPDLPYVDDTSIQRQLAQMAKKDPKADKFKTADIVDHSIMREVEAMGIKKGTN